MAAKIGPPGSILRHTPNILQSNDKAKPASGAVFSPEAMVDFSRFCKYLPSISLWGKSLGCGLGIRDKAGGSPKHRPFSPGYIMASDNGKSRSMESSGAEVHSGVFSRFRKLPIMDKEANILIPGRKKSVPYLKF